MINYVTSQYHRLSSPELAEKSWEVVLLPMLTAVLFIGGWDSHRMMVSEQAFSSPRRTINCFFCLFLCYLCQTSNLLKTQILGKFLCFLWSPPFVPSNLLFDILDGSLEPSVLDLPPTPCVILGSVLNRSDVEPSFIEGHFVLINL